MRKISSGQLTKENVLLQNINMYKAVFIEVNNQVRKLDEAVREYFPEIGGTGQSKVIQRKFSACGKCSTPMDLKSQGEVLMEIV